MNRLPIADEPRRRCVARARDGAGRRRRPRLSASWPWPACSEYGYRVLEAGSGVECLELLGREASVDLLLIDYAMPEMNGAETVRLARRMRPELQVLFITGYADLRALHEHVGPNAIVQKPFKLAQLAERVAVGLARRPAVARRVA